MSARIVGLSVFMCTFYFESFLIWYKEIFLQSTEGKALSYIYSTDFSLFYLDIICPQNGNI